MRGLERQVPILALVICGVGLACPGPWAIAVTALAIAIAAALVVRNIATIGPPNLWRSSKRRRRRSR